MERQREKQSKRQRQTDSDRQMWVQRKKTHMHTRKEEGLHFMVIP